MTTVSPRAVSEQLGGLGAQLRQARLRAHLSQREIAASAGLSRQLVGRVEAGANGEVRAYLSVASALGLNLVAEPQVALNDHELAAIEYVTALDRGDYLAG